MFATGRSDQAAQVDAIVVMGAAQYDGRPSPQLAARLDHVVTLYAEGLAPFVVVTGGKQPADRFTEAEASRDYLVERGVPADAILLESEGRTTYESMEGVADLLEARGLRRVLVVTDPFHSLRSRMIAERRRLAGLRVADAEHAWSAAARRSAARSSRRPASPSVASSASTALTRRVDARRVSLSESPIHSPPLHGEWCNWQHSRFWFCY